MSPSFDTLRQDTDSRQLIRKIQKAIAVIGRRDAVELPESLYGVDGQLIDLKALGWLPVGIVTPDGYSFPREVESETIDALGYASPVRSDTTKVPRQITFTPLEKGRRHMAELTLGTDLTGTTQDPETGEIVFDEPDLPVGEEYRLLVIGSDGPASENWVLGKGYGSVKLNAGGSETWGQEGAVSSEITLDVFTDDEIGTPVRHYMGGTGALKHKDLLGFTGTPASGA